MRKTLMQKSKKALSFLLIVVMVLTALPAISLTAFASTGEITGHWAEKALNSWISKGWLHGDEGGNYLPEGSVTRAEFMAFVNRMMGYTELSDTVTYYPDVPIGNWYYSDVAKALNAGYIQGSNGLMMPEAPMTRNEAVVIIARIARLNTTDVNAATIANISDGADVPAWAKPALLAVVAEGYITGSDKGKFNGASNIARSEAVVLLDRLNTDTRIYAFAGTYGPASGTVNVENVSILAPGVTLQNMKVAGDLTVAASVGNGEATLMGVIVFGKMNVLGGLDNIYLNDCTMKELMIEKDSVRVVLDNDSVISFARMDGDNDILELKGNTKIETLTIVGEGAAVKTEHGVSIATLNVTGKNAKITGQGSITTANISAAGATLEKAPTHIKIDSGLTANVGGRTITGGNTGGGGGGITTVSYQSDDAVDKVVSYGTQIGDLNLPMSVTLTANTGATGTATVTWNYSTYKSTTVGTYTITGTLSDATVAWAPATISMAVTVQAALTVTGGTTVADVTVKSSDDVAVVTARLPAKLTLTLSDGASVQVSLLWTCAAYSNTAGAENTFTAAVSGLPSTVAAAPAISARVNVAATNTPVATVVKLTAIPASVQKPATAANAKVVLSAVVKDQFDDTMVVNVGYALEGAPITGVSYALEGGSIPTVTITEGSAATSVVATVTVTGSSPSITDSVTIYITNTPVVATVLTITEFVSSMILPITGNTSTFPFKGEVKDQKGGVMADAITWSVKTNVTGVTIDTDTGIVTISPNATGGASFTVVAASGSLTAEQTVTISKATSEVASVTVIGDAEIALPGTSESSVTQTYTAVIKDQYGTSMMDAVAWSVTTTPGVSISNGVLTITSGTLAGTVTVTATVGAKSGTKIVTIKNIPAAATVAVLPATPTILLPASHPSAGPDAAQVFTATVTDQYGKKMEGATVAWSIQATTGVSIVQNGTLTVTSAAAPGTVTVTATIGGKSGSATASIAKGAAAFSAITVSGPSAITKNSTGTYTATATDQYGAPFAAQTYVWSIDTPPTGVSIDAGTGVVTVASTAITSQTFTVKATSGGKSGTFRATVSSGTGIAMPTNVAFTRDLQLSWSYAGSAHVEFSAILKDSGDREVFSKTMRSTERTSPIDLILSHITVSGQYTLEFRAVASNEQNSSDPVILAVNATLENAISVTDITKIGTATSDKYKATGTFPAGHYTALFYTGDTLQYSNGQTVAAVTEINFTHEMDATSATIQRFYGIALSDADKTLTATLTKPQADGIAISNGTLSAVPAVTNSQFSKSSHVLFLRWTNPAVTNIDSFKVYYSRDSGTTWLEYAPSFPVIENGVTAMLLLGGKSDTETYQVKIVSIAKAGFANAETVSAATLAVTENATPVNLIAATLDAGTKTLTVAGTFVISREYFLDLYNTTTHTHEMAAVVATSATTLTQSVNSTGNNLTLTIQEATSTVTGGSATVTLSVAQSPAMNVLAT